MSLRAVGPHREQIGAGMKRTAVVIVVLVLLNSGGCSPSGPNNVLPPRTPPSRAPNTIDRFTADPPTTHAGEAVTLSWAVSGTVDHCTLSTGIEPSPRIVIAERLPAAGGLVVHPTETTWYALVTYLEDGRAVVESNVRVVVE